MNEQNKFGGKKRIITLCTFIILLISIVTIIVYAKSTKGESEISIVSIETSQEEILEEFPQEEQIPITTEQRLDFIVTSKGRGNLSTFNISVITTDGRKIDLGEFSFALREVEMIRLHGDKFQETLIDYIIPNNWNSTQKLTDEVSVKEKTKNPVRAPIGDEPLFIRGIDYPEDIPFDEIEIQVDGLNYFTDEDESEYIAWIRILENEKLFDIKEIKIEG